MILEIKNLRISYSSNVLVKNINLTARDGQLIALIGRNGTGKSTFLRSILSLQPVAGGDILADGKSILAMSLKTKATLLSYVSTSVVDTEFLTARDVVTMGRTNLLGWNGTVGQNDFEAVDRALALVGASEYSDRNITTLSDGERQRVMIARAIAQETPVIVLDEPTAFLDVPSRVKITSLLHTLSKESGKLIIFSTHEIELAKKYADIFWFVGDGRITSYTSENLSLPADFQV